MKQISNPVAAGCAMRLLALLVLVGGCAPGQPKKEAGASTPIAGASRSSGSGGDNTPPPMGGAPVRFCTIAEGLDPQHRASEPFWESRTCIPAAEHGQPGRCHLARLYADGARYLMTNYAPASAEAIWRRFTDVAPAAFCELEAELGKLCGDTRLAPGRPFRHPPPIEEIRVKAKRCTQSFVPDFGSTAFDPFNAIIQKHAAKIPARPE